MSGVMKSGDLKSLLKKTNIKDPKSVFKLLCALSEKSPELIFLPEGQLYTDSYEQFRSIHKILRKWMKRPPLTSEHIDPKFPILAEFMKHRPYLEHIAQTPDKLWPNHEGLLREAYRNIMPTLMRSSTPCHTNILLSFRLHLNQRNKAWRNSLEQGELVDIMKAIVSNIRENSPLTPKILAAFKQIARQTDRVNSNSDSNTLPLMYFVHLAAPLSKMDDIPVEGICTAAQINFLSIYKALVRLIPLVLHSEIDDKGMLLSLKTLLEQVTSIAMKSLLHGPITENHWVFAHSDNRRFIQHVLVSHFLLLPIIDEKMDSEHEHPHMPKLVKDILTIQPNYFSILQARLAHYYPKAADNPWLQQQITRLQICIQGKALEPEHANDHPYQAPKQSQFDNLTNPLSFWELPVLSAETARQFVEEAKDVGSLFLFEFFISLRDIYQHDRKIFDGLIAQKATLLPMFLDLVHIVLDPEWFSLSEAAEPAYYGHWANNALKATEHTNQDKQQHARIWVFTKIITPLLEQLGMTALDWFTFVKKHILNRDEDWAQGITPPDLCDQPNKIQLQLPQDTAEPSPPFTIKNADEYIRLITTDLHMIRKSTSEPCAAYLTALTYLSIHGITNHLIMAYNTLANEKNQTTLRLFDQALFMISRIRQQAQHKFIQPEQSLFTLLLATALKGNDIKKPRLKACELDQCAEIIIEIHADLGKASTSPKNTPADAVLIALHHLGKRDWGNVADPFRLIMHIHNIHKYSTEALAQNAAAQAVLDQDLILVLLQFFIQFTKQPAQQHAGFSKYAEFTLPFCMTTLWYQTPKLVTQLLEAICLLGYQQALQQPSNVQSLLKPRLDDTFIEKLKLIADYVPRPLFEAADTSPKEWTAEMPDFLAMLLGPGYAYTLGTIIGELSTWPSEKCTSKAAQAFCQESFANVKEDFSIPVDASIFYLDLPRPIGDYFPHINSKIGKIIHAEQSTRQEIAESTQTYQHSILEHAPKHITPIMMQAVKLLPGCISYQDGLILEQHMTVLRHKLMHNWFDPSHIPTEIVQKIIDTPKKIEAILDQVMALIKAPTHQPQQWMTGMMIYFCQFVRTTEDDQYRSTHEAICQHQDVIGLPYQNINTPQNQNILNAIFAQLAAIKDFGRYSCLIYADNLPIIQFLRVTATPGILNKAHTKQYYQLLKTLVSTIDFALWRFHDAGGMLWHGFDNHLSPICFAIQSIEDPQERLNALAWFFSQTIEVGNTETSGTAITEIADRLSIITQDMLTEHSRDLINRLCGVLLKHFPVSNEELLGCIAIFLHHTGQCVQPESGMKLKLKLPKEYRDLLRRTWESYAENNTDFLIEVFELIVMPIIHLDTEASIVELALQQTPVLDMLKFLMARKIKDKTLLTYCKQKQFKIQQHVDLLLDHPDIQADDIVALLAETPDIIMDIPQPKRWLTWLEAHDPKQEIKRQLAPWWSLRLLSDIISFKFKTDDKKQPYAPLQEKLTSEQTDTLIEINDVLINKYHTITYNITEDRITPMICEQDSTEQLWQAFQEAFFPPEIIAPSPSTPTSERPPSTPISPEITKMRTEITTRFQDLYNAIGYQPGGTVNSIYQTLLDTLQAQEADFEAIEDSGSAKSEYRLINKALSALSETQKDLARTLSNHEKPQKKKKLKRQQTPPANPPAPRRAPAAAAAANVAQAMPLAAAQKPEPQSTAIKPALSITYDMNVLLSAHHVHLADLAKAVLPESCSLDDKLALMVSASSFYAYIHDELGRHFPAKYKLIDPFLLHFLPECMLIDKDTPWIKDLALTFQDSRDSVSEVLDHLQKLAEPAGKHDYEALVNMAHNRAQRLTPYVTICTKAYEQLQKQGGTHRANIQLIEKVYGAWRLITKWHYFAQWQVIGKQPTMKTDFQTASARLKKDPDYRAALPTLHAIRHQRNLQRHTTRDVDNDAYAISKTYDVLSFNKVLHDSAHLFGAKPHIQRNPAALAFEPAFCGTSSESGSDREEASASP